MSSGVLSKMVELHFSQLIIRGASNTVFSETDDTQTDYSTDLEEIIYDTIAKHIFHKFKGV